MPTKNPRFSITVDKKMDDAIDEYQHQTRAKNKTQAVVELIQIGMARLEAEDAKKQSVGVSFGNSYNTTLGDVSEEMEKPYTSFEAKGDEITVEEMTVLLRNLGYLREGDTLSKYDRDFLSNLFGMLDAWFERKGM